MDIEVICLFESLFFSTIVEFFTRAGALPLAEKGCTF